MSTLETHPHDRTARSICVYCASSSTIDPKYLTLADELGRAIAASGCTLVTGGGSVSMMGAIARGARSAGGWTVGVIPAALVALEVADHDADELIVTTDMRHRKGVMDARSDAFIAMPGGIGTLEELMEVWTAHTLSMHSKPVVILDPWDDWAPLHELVKSMQHKGFVRETAASAVVWTKDIPTALAAAIG